MISSLPTTKDNPVIDINPFCADAIQKSILSFSISIGTIAYVEVVSTIKIASCACAIAPISRIGFPTPVPVSLCVVYTTAISGFSFIVFSTTLRSGCSPIGNCRLI